jgi:DNA gyrase/topoisomerase IV subunit A
MAKPIIKTVTDYLDNDYKEYAVYVVEERAIPSVIDGFKPTQRKVIFIANKVWRNGSEKPLKIFQLAGRVAADAFYHHGDGSLNSAIIGMAQRFKNSMPVLEDIGQFGSLRSPEAAAPRYIATKLHRNFRLLYKDFELLESRYEEGNEIEPKYFLPIIPTVLLNGGSGIAVGFSTNILNRNPMNLIDSCLKSLEGKRYTEPSPWYREFEGSCDLLDTPDSKFSWLFSGKYEIKNTSTVVVSELPPSITYEKFDQHLIDLEDSRRIVSYDNNCKSDINYVIKFRREDLKTLTDSSRLNRFLKMEEKQTENFTVLDEFGKLKVFTSASEIIEYFVAFRLTFYDKRKKYLIDKAEQELLVLSNKARFISDIISSKLKVNNVPRKEIILYLQTADYDEVNGSYQYLLSLPIYTLTKETYEELRLAESQKIDEIAKLKAMEPKQMYKDDLQELKRALQKEYNS